MNRHLDPDPEDWGRIPDPLKEIEKIHKDYYAQWHTLPEDLNEYDDFIINLFNELEDLFNPSRLNGN